MNIHRYLASISIPLFQICIHADRPVQGVGLIVAVLYTAMMNTRSCECSEGAKELLAERIEVAVTRSGEAPFDAVRVHESPKVSGVSPSGDNNRKVEVKKVVRFAVGTATLVMSSSLMLVDAY